MGLVVGLDVGTQSVKLVAYDAQTRRVAVVAVVVAGLFPRFFIALAQHRFADVVGHQQLEPVHQFRGRGLFLQAWASAFRRLARSAMLWRFHWAKPAAARLSAASCSASEW